MAPWWRRPDDADEVTPPATPVAAPALPLPPGRIADEPADLLKAARNGFQADVYLVHPDDPARQFVRKDMRARHAIVRATWARWLTAREGRALARLAGSGVAPRLLRAEGAVLEMERVGGERLPRRAAGGRMTPEEIAAVRRAIAAMHACGVAHGDLRRTNIFLDRATGAVRLIDFGTAWVGGAGAGPVARAMFRLVRRVDGATIDRLLASYGKQPNGALPEEGGRDEYPWFLRWGRALRQRIYRPLKHLLVPSRRRSSRREGRGGPGRDRR